MRETTAFPIPLCLLALLLAFLPGNAFCQDPALEAEIAAAPDADASPEAIGLTIPEVAAGSPCAESLPGLVRLADVQQGRLLLKTARDGVYLPAPLLETTVAIHVTGLVARAAVTQRFCNPAEVWVEGVYAFPLPENAAVDSLKMVIGERVVEGKIREREEARREYQQAKAEGKKASLLEQQRPNLFTTSLANLGPGEIAEVRIEYQQELRYDGGKFSLRFPLVAESRYMPAGGPHLSQGEEGENLAKDQSEPAVPDPPRSHQEKINPVRLTVDLQAGFPLGRLESASHAIHSRQVEPLRYQVDLADEVVPADRDFVLEWRPAAGATPAASLFAQEIDGDIYALLMVMPPAEAKAARFDLPREIVYIIDTSGSMSGASIREAKASLDLALTRLEPRDSFNVIEFNSFTRRLFPASVPASVDRVEEAREWVAQLNAEGGTEMLGALEAALVNTEVKEGTVRQVVFMTDGAVGNEDQLFTFIQANLGESRLFTVGIGSAPSSHFMTRAAELGRGTFTYIGSPEEVAGKVGELFAKLARPALTEVEVAWSDPGAEIFPQRIPDLYHGEPIVVVARLLPGFPEEVTLSGSTQGTLWEVPIKSLPTLPRSGLDKLWARRKIAELDKQLVLGGDAEKLRRAIVELGLAHHLVTKFTSLVAVDTTPTAPADAQPRTTLLPVNVPAGWQPGVQAGVLPQGGTSARLDLLLGLALSIAALLLLTRLRPRKAETLS